MVSGGGGLVGEQVSLVSAAVPVLLPPHRPLDTDDVIQSSRQHQCAEDAEDQSTRKT